MTIIGVSFDTPDANAAFKTSQSFELALWSDVQRELAVYYGAADTSSCVAYARLRELVTFVKENSQVF